MSELTGEARALLGKARGAHDAPSGARERVRAGVALALVAEAAEVGGAGAALRVGASATRGTVARMAVVLAVVAGGVAAVLTYTKGHATMPPSTTPAVAVTAPSVLATASEQAAAPPPSAVDVPVQPASPTPDLAPPVPRASSPRSAPPDRSVAAEVALLRKVSDALRAGDAKSALAGVDEHARRFPNGALAEERETERIVALCALDRRDEAARFTARFSRHYPSSSHAARIRAACAAPAPSETP